MEILYGIGGVIGFGILAAVMGLDLRSLFGRRQADPFAWMYDDPNSTIGVTREVLEEQGESWRTTELLPAG
jgi:hypothetical protein